VVQVKFDLAQAQAKLDLQLKNQHLTPTTAWSSSAAATTGGVPFVQGAAPVFTPPPPALAPRPASGGLLQSKVTQYNLSGNIIANDPAALQRDIEAKARMAALAGIG
jgi:hypothetical protein